MVEIIAKNADDFNIMKPYSDYSSVLTGVLSFDRNNFDSLCSKFPDILKEYQKNDSQIMITDQIKPKVIAIPEKHLIEINGATIDMMCYLGAYSIYDGKTVKYKEFPKLFNLIEADIVDLDESFINSMTYVANSSDIKQLFSSYFKKKHLKKMISLSTAEDIKTIGDLNFLNYQIVETKYKHLYGLVVQAFLPSEKKIYLENPINGNKYELNTFYIPEIYNNIFQKDRMVSIQVGRILGNNKDYVVNSFNVIPSNYTLNIDISIKGPRKYPLSIFNAAYREFIYRYKKGVKQPK